MSLPAEISHDSSFSTSHPPAALVQTAMVTAITAGVRWRDRLGEPWSQVNEDPKAAPRLFSSMKLYAANVVAS